MNLNEDPSLKLLLFSGEAGPQRSCSGPVDLREESLIRSKWDCPAQTPKTTRDFELFLRSWMGFWWGLVTFEFWRTQFGFSGFQQPWWLREVPQVDEAVKDVNTNAPGWDLKGAAERVQVLRRTLGGLGCTPGISVSLKRFQVSGGCRGSWRDFSLKLWWIWKTQGGL